MADIQPPVELSVTSRPTSSNLALAWILVFFEALVCFLPWIEFHFPNPAHSTTERVAMYGWCLAGGFALFGLVLLNLAWYCRSSITVSSEGIRQRFLWGERLIPWAAVSDYYYEDTPSQYPIIETSSGKLRLQPTMWNNTTLLEQVIQKQATEAKVSSWQRLGLRPVDEWPKTYRYAASPHYWLIAGLVLIQVLVIAFRTPDFVRRETIFHLLIEAGDYSVPSVAFFLFAIAFYALQFCIFGVVAFCIWRSARARRNRSYQTIIASQTELTYHDERQTFTVRWEDVTDFRSTQKPRSLAYLWVVETTHGDFDFESCLHSPTSLCRVIRHLTNHSDWPRKAEVFDERLGGTASQWTGATAGEGDRVFHYRTRTNRALLMVVLFMFSLPAIFSFLDSKVELLKWFLAVVPIAVFWLFYCLTEIHIGQGGMLFLSPFRKTRILWEQVASVKIDASLGTILICSTTPEKKIRLWPALTDYGELIAEVERRVPK
jgi:hypothetical protein